MRLKVIERGKLVSRVATRKRITSVRTLSAHSELIPYQVAQKSKDYDLRIYSPYVVAECRYVFREYAGGHQGLLPSLLLYCSYERRDEGFLLLGDYLTASEMKETQPVVMTHSKSGKTMQVYLVASSGETPSLDTLPVPSSSRVSLNIAGGALVAVGQLQLGAPATRESCLTRRKMLIESLHRDGMLTLKDEDEFQVAQYGPLNSLAPRLSEVWLTLQL